MAKDPAILFYTSDFLTGTMFMSNEQVGKYIRLLCAQHQKGRLTEKDMLNICNSYDEDIFEKFTEEGGKFYNIRLEAEIIKRRKYSESRSNNRKGNKKDKKDMNNICKTYDKHMENENENINRDINKSINIEFDEFWNLYDYKKGDKKKLEKKWLSLKDSERNKIIQYLPDYKKSTPDKQYRKHPATFLNNKGWEDEIIINNKSKHLQHDTDF